MNIMGIVLLFYLMIFCYSSTEDKYMLKYFSYGTSNSFDFYNKYKTYILRGQIQSSYKSLDVNIFSSENITAMGYLYSNIEFNFPEDMKIHLKMQAQSIQI